MQTFYRPWDGVSGAAGDTIDRRSVTLKSIEIRPNDVVYGGQFGFETFLSNRFLDRFFAGAYYPKQVVNKTIRRSSQSQ